MPRETDAVSAHVPCTPYKHAQVYCVILFELINVWLWWFLIFFKDGKRGCLRCRYAGFSIKRIISCHVIQLKPLSLTHHKTPCIYLLGVLFYIYYFIYRSICYICTLRSPISHFIIIDSKKTKTKKIKKIKEALEKTVFIHI